MNGFYLSNPLGLLALLAVPAIVATHFLQRRARPIRVSTLFLIEPRKRPTSGGRIISFIRQSTALWLQLLAALLLAFVLSQPRVLAKESTQQVTIVVDSTWSMLAFREAAIRAVGEIAERLEPNAARTEWRLLGTDRQKPPLYAGADASALRTAMASWMPESGVVDPHAALSQALRGGAENPVIFLTDHEQKTPAGVTTLMVGSVLTNMGFAGLEADPTGWKVLVQNHSAVPQNRNWWITAPDGTESPRQKVVLGAWETAALSGNFDGDAFALHLEPDAFPLDDTLPLVRPGLKVLRVELAGDSDAFGKIVESLPEVVTGGTTEPAVRIGPLSPDDAWPSAGSGIAWRSGTAQERKLSGEPVFAERHPLVRDLDWNGLLVADEPPITLQMEDEPLVWGGSRPLILLRRQAGKSILIFAFDPSASNLERLPGFVLLCGRFLETLRRDAPGLVRENFELLQNLGPSLPAGVSASVASGGLVQNATFAPALAGPFTVAGPDGVPLLEGAAHFAENREADFRRAATGGDLTAIESALRDRNRNIDFYSPLWLLLALVALLAYWALPTRAT